MKPSKRIQNAIRDLGYLKTNYLEYFLSGRPDSMKECEELLANIASCLENVAMEQKVHNIKIAKKLGERKDVQENKKS